ncbi:glycosyltransferase [Mangrovimicrobium sediminis]|uniref:Glycosyltransferase n=1 Tax=Mangrovimicrobium sediminis TaxID=2562682 RepID=A0A4Z0M1E3_9GAMM|nr:glycosyltransferase family 4 protein [Haliea sp. SAOS-164]TGD73115.1 glycosyltransferase [Haliea sp. SAOS-164]
MKVLFLPKYPEEGASSRYRVYQYLPYLAAAGIDYRVVPFMSPALYRLSQQPGHTLRKSALYLLASLRRLALLFDWRHVDLVYMQRECLPLGPLLLERWFRLRGRRLVFDYDDALFIHKANSHSRLFSRLKNPARIPRIMALCDLVVAGNDWLRERAAQYCPRAVTFHVAEDLQRYTPKPPDQPGEDVTIGWLGSPSTEKYLELLRPVLVALAERHPGLRLKIVGGGRFTEPRIEVEHVAWSLDTEVAELHSFDIGVMPLPMEEWSQGKSGGKARTYMAAGLPCVCTDIGYNRELLEDGQTGFLARDEQDWLNKLEALIGDRALRERIGGAARRDVEARFDLQKQGPAFARLLLSAADPGAGVNS